MLNEGGSKVQVLHWIEDRVLAKLEGWKGNLLNQASKEILIKVVVQTIPSYVMSILKLPKTFSNSFTSAIAKFWWSSYGKQRGIH